ncbi:MAG: TlpA family protein disulfide reductase [Alphaproteobacteria bacterium]
MQGNRLVSTLVAVMALLGGMGIALWALPRQASVPEGGRPALGMRHGLTLLKTPTPAPAVAFTDGSGREVHLSDWRGRLLVVNLWATWCTPCVREMPSLNRLAETLDREKFAVIAISEDKNTETARQFLEKNGLDHLAPYFDPGLTLSRALNVNGLPSTLLIDPEGQVFARVIGMTEWDSPEWIERLESWRSPVTTDRNQK